MQRVPSCRRLLCLRRWATPSHTLATASVRWHGSASDHSSTHTQGEPQRRNDTRKRRESAASSSVAAAATATCARETDTLEHMSGPDAFAYLYNDLSSSIDVAPVRRPRLAGSLQCSLTGYPVTFLLVEDCEGTTSEEVTRRVQQRAVNFAAHVQSATGLRVGTFLRGVCDDCSTVMAHLCSMDLSLQLSLSLVTSPSTGDAAVRCGAALYDPWGSEPRPTSLGLCGRRRGGAVVGAVPRLEGALTEVVVDVLAEVRRDLLLRCTALVAEGVEEASRYVSEAGREASQRWLTAQLHDASLAHVRSTLRTGAGLSAASRFTQRSGLQRGEATTPLPLSYALSCSCWKDTARSTVVGLQMALEHVNARGADSGTPRRPFASSTVNHGLVPLTLAAATPDDEDCVLSNDRAFTSQLCGEGMTTGPHAVGARRPRLAVVSSWNGAPLAVCGHLIEWAAAASPSVAHDWIDAERCGEVTAAPPTCAPSERLPDLVRWSTFAGRGALDLFLTAAGGAVEWRLLPPLWPRVEAWRNDAGAERRVAALREVLRSEHGLRHVRRTQHAVPTAARAPVVFEYDAEVATRSGAEGANTAAALRVGGAWYADVEAAARVHTPWVLPHYGSAPGSRSCGPPVASAVKKKRRGGGVVVVRVPSVTACLRRCGVVRATWDAAAAELVCHRTHPLAPPLRFRQLDSVDGVGRLLRFCAGSPDLAVVRYKASHESKSVSRLLDKMMAATVGSEGEGDGGTAPHPSPLPLDVEHTLIADFRLPFDAGRVRLSAATAEARARETFRLLLHVCDVSDRSFHLLATLRTSQPADSTFFDYWGVTLPWMYPRGHLRVDVVASAATTASTVAVTGCAEPLPRWDVIADPLTIHVACLRTTSETGTAAAVAVAGGADDGWSVQRSVVFSLSGVTWLGEVYAAIRGALLSQPHDADHLPSTTSHRHAAPLSPLDVEGDDAARLLAQCRDYGDLCHAVLCRYLSPRFNLVAVSPSLLIRQVLGHGIFFAQSGETYALHLQVTPTVQVVLVSTTAEEVKKIVAAHSRFCWQDAVAYVFNEATAPALNLTLSALSTLESKWRALCDAADWDGTREHVRIRWAASTEATASSLLFTAEVLRPSSPSSPANGTATTAAAFTAAEVVREGFRVVCTATGDSLADVLNRVRGEYVKLGRSYPGFLRAAHVHIAERLKVQRVSLRYEDTAKRLCVLGWGSAQDASVAVAPPVCLAEEVVAWHDVPEALFRLHRRLAAGAADRRKMLSPDALRIAPMQTLLCLAAEELCCAPELLSTSCELLQKLWRCSITLPLSLFCLERGAIAATARIGDHSGFRLTAISKNKKKAERALMLHIYTWRFGGSTADGGGGPAAAAAAAAGVSADMVRVSCVAVDDIRDVAAPAPVRVRHAVPDRGFLVPPHAPTRTARTTPTSLVECLHAEMQRRLGELMEGAGGHIVLRLSQTFGLVLTYEGDTPDGNGDGDGVVQLTRAAWQRDVWAPAQILRAEATVLAQLVGGVATATEEEEGGRVAGLRAVLRAVDRGVTLPQLRLGGGASRRDFCVSFFRRYLGWRVCEEGDLADLPVSDPRGSVVAYETLHLGEVKGRSSARASLRLGQIVSPEDRNVRLAQVLVRAEDFDVEAVQAALWDGCARRVKDVFGVSRLMTAAEVDAAMLRFLENTPTPHGGEKDHVEDRRTGRRKE